MTDQIVTRASQFDRGAAAFVRGVSRDDHGMNIGVPAIADWQAGHDAASAAYAHATQLQAEAVTLVLCEKGH